jgi:hypothetical protein
VLTLTAPHILAKDLRGLFRLKALELALPDRPSDPHHIILLEPGPFFYFARARIERSIAGRNKALFTHWSQSLERWRATIDAVIWLDAPDTTLIERIRARPKCHRVKQATDREISMFLAHYRAAYRKLLFASDNGIGPRVFAHDTACISTDELTTAVVRQLNGLRGTRSDA